MMKFEDYAPLSPRAMQIREEMKPSARGGLAEMREVLADRRMRLSATAQLGKLGVDIELAKGDQPWDTKSLLARRAELRRAMNKLSASVDRKDPESLTDETLDAMSYLGAEVSAISAELDLREIGKMVGGGAPSDWVDASGRPVAVLGPGEPIARYDPNRASFGAFIRGLALGSTDPRVRAELGEAAIGTGGATVPQHTLSELIDAMRARTVCVQSGARTVLLDTEKTTIAKITGDPTATWRNENALVALSDPTFAAVTFQARSLAVLVKVSVELLQDSVNIENALLQAFAGSMAAQVDAVALKGTGVAPQPTGIWNTVGIGSSTPASLTYGALLDAIETLKTANANDPTAIILNPGDWRTLAGLADTTGQPLQPPPALATIPQRVTTGIGAGEIIVGDFSQLLLGVRQELRVEVLREGFMDKLQVGFLAHLRMDVQLAQPAAFAKIAPTA